MEETDVLIRIGDYTIAAGVTCNVGEFLVNIGKLIELAGLEKALELLQQRHGEPT